MEIIEIKVENGCQFIEIPKEFKIEANKVYLKKTGNIISIITSHNPWQNFFDSLSLFTADFMEERNGAS